MKSTKRGLSLALAAMFVVLGTEGYTGSQKFENQRVSKIVAASERSQEDYGPKAMSVKIGKKLKDEELSSDGIHILSNNATANTRAEFMQILHDYMNCRKTNFTITFNGSYKKIYKNMDIDTTFADVFWKIDDQSNSDDFDYLHWNVSRYAFNIPMYTSKKSVFKFKIQYNENAAKLAQVNAAIPEIIEELNLQNMTQLQQIKTIHDYICETVTYDHSLKKYAAYDAIVSPSRKTVCQGYSLLFYKLCTEVGIPCRFIGGHAYTGGRSVNHAWNIVKLDGKWYYVDTTWDDTDNKKNPMTYDYFLIGSKKMKKDHVLDKEYNKAYFKKKYPIATGNYNWKDMLQKEEKPVAEGVVGTDVRPTVTPTETPKATTKPTVTPYVPTATPNVTKQPTATPDIMNAPTQTPEITDSSQPYSTPKNSWTPDDDYGYYDRYDDFWDWLSNLL